MAPLDEFEKDTASIKHYKSSKPSIATDIIIDTYHWNVQYCCIYKNE